MIKKLEITHVGRFKSFKTDGDDQYFKKNTYIYGKNTFGKSTLTAILRSLKENNPDIIVGRKTIGSQKQFVEILSEGKNPTEYRYSTDEGRWTSEYKNMIIFDNQFVRENVYTQNQQIGQHEQKNIEAFMLGAKGFDYRSKITSIDEQISENTLIQTSTSNEYSRSKHLLGGLNFDDFLKLTKIVDRDKKIKKEKKDLDKIKNSELINSKLKSVRTLLEKLKDFDTAPISEKLSVNSDLIAEHFRGHVNQKETRQTYSTFLQTGSKLRTRTDNEKCPFCTQDIKGDSVKEFIKTIDLFYNEKYSNLQQAIKVAEVLFQKSSFSSEIENISTDLKQVGYVLEIDFSDISDLFENCGKSLTNKKDDLASELDNLPFLDISKKAADHIATIDGELVNFNNLTERKIELENSIERLQANKERFDSWKEKCDAYLKAQKDSKTIGSKKTNLWDEYLSYVSGLSTTMRSDINDVLIASDCSFTVQEFNFKGNQRQELFVLSMNGSQINNDGEDRDMTIKNSLSDSDKWVLALAFFLATVKNDSTLKVVVMDDPVSSFDVDRKRIILREIKRVLTGTNKQLILLTHEKNFYHLSHVENAGDSSAAFLRISVGAKGSELIACNPDNDADFMSDYNCWITDMKCGLDSQDLQVVKKAHSNIRFIIEHILKAKYPLELGSDISTIEKMLNKLEEVGGSYGITSRRASIASVCPNLSHHDSSGKGQYPVSNLGINDYKKDIKDAFEVIKIL